MGIAKFALGERPLLTEFRNFCHCYTEFRYIIWEFREWSSNLERPIQVPPYDPDMLTDQGCSPVRVNGSHGGLYILPA